MDRMQDIVKKERVKELYKVADLCIMYTEEIKKRSQEIMSQSKIRTFDSLHLAAAEAAGADVMLTTDDKREKMSERINLKVKVMNPLRFAWEAIYNDEY